MISASPYKLPQRLLRALLTGASLCLLTGYLIRQAQLKKAMRRQLRNAKLALLRTQMNPHFLFNTLNAINSYIVAHQTADASHYLTTFSRLIRITLDHSKQNQISLSCALDALALYLNLERMRLNHSFDYRIRMDKLIDPERTTIPPLILQPFVENAVWHGLALRPTPGQITIDVTGGCHQPLKIRIVDNGIGRAAAARHRQKPPGSSRGIALVRNQLHLLHEKNTIKITDLYDQNNRPSGTKVTLTINPHPHDQSLYRR